MQLYNFISSHDANRGEVGVTETEIIAHLQCSLEDFRAAMDALSQPKQQSTAVHASSGERLFFG